MRLLLLVLLASCTTLSTIDGQNPLPQNCAMESMSVGLKWGDVKLPASGRMVMESHYVTVEDNIPGYPKAVKENIKDHLARSCVKLRELFPAFGISSDCSDIYKGDVAEWTPSENGRVGENARSLKPPMIEEMWQGNFYFAPGKIVKAGTKFLVSYKDRSAVLSFGREVGPSSRRYLGGMTSEAHFYLGTNNESPVLVGLLQDQSVPFGPIICKQ